MFMVANNIKNNKIAFTSRYYCTELTEMSWRFLQSIKTILIMGGSSNDNREYDYCTGLKHIALFFLGIVYQHTSSSNVQPPGRPALSLVVSGL